MPTPAHPFDLPYVGLGLLDEASIRRDGDAWTAEYRIGDEPYLAIRVAPGRVEIQETEGGRMVARTIEQTLNRAVGLHGQGALTGDISRFWNRAAERADMAWVQLSPRDIQFTFIPAIGMGRLCVPSPFDALWTAPEAGPLARRLGFEPFAGPECVRGATLLRSVVEEAEARVERVRLHLDTIPGILLAETVEALYAANGPLRAIEWRPFVLHEPLDRVAQTWPGPRPTRLPDGATMVGFALVED